MSKSRIESFLKDMTYHTHFEFLEEGKQKDELTKIAEKRGIKLPCHDLAVFKGRYAYVDRMNKNNCILPKEEVEKALETLNGKAVDFDHLRKNVVGYWVDGKIDGDEIIAYGIFFKGNFATEYEDIKKMMEGDVLAISFEAWGNRNFGANGVYNLTDIEFAGGALLIKTNPAFPGSQVIEMSNQGKILEFAKVMTPPEQFLHTGDMPKKIEESRYHMYDIQSIARQLAEVDCLNCSMKGFMDVQHIDFANNKAAIKCLNCESEMAVSLTPDTKLTKKGKKIKQIKENEIPCHATKTNGNENQEEDKTMKGLFEKFTVSTVKTIFQEIAKVTINRELSDVELNLAYSLTEYTAQKRAGTLSETRSLLDIKGKSSASPTSLMSAEILEDDIKTAITEVAKDTELENAKKTETEKAAEEATKKLKEAEGNEKLVQALKELEDTKKVLAEAQAKLAVIDAEKAEAAKKAKEIAIKTRRDELGEEFAKTLNDEDIMNEDKYTIAKQNKVIAALQKGEKVDMVKLDLTKGSADKEVKPEAESRKKIRELAYGKEDTK
jgi:hypothetical protein